MSARAALLAWAVFSLLLGLALGLTGCGTPDIPRRPAPSAEPGGLPPGPPMVPLLRLRF